MLRNRLTITAVAIMVMMAGASAYASVALDEFVASSATDPENVAVVVVDLENGETIDSYNADKALIPASVMKAVTISSLIGETGIDYVYQTNVYTDGRISDGVLDGNLIVEGAGDPSLNAKTAPESPDFVKEIVNALNEKGITSIKGRVIIDESVFAGPDVPPSWASGDLPHAYGTGIHGFNFENNACGKSSVKNPASVFESRLRTAMTSAGITLEGESLRQGNRKLLFSHRSATIDEIMRSCMMRSDNLYAECLLRTYALARGKEASTANAADLETRYWKSNGLPMQGIKIVDGSGLSRENRLTANFLAKVLEHTADNVDYVSFFPLAGQEGTLRNFLKDTPLDSYIAMKTGSMNGIQCYAGYKLDDDFAPTHAVVIIMNNVRDRGAIRKATQDMLLKIFTNPQ